MAFDRTITCGLNVRNELANNKSTFLAREGDNITKKTRENTVEYSLGKEIVFCAEGSLFFRCHCLRSEFQVQKSNTVRLRVWKRFSRLPRLTIDGVYRRIENKSTKACDSVTTSILTSLGTPVVAPRTARCYMMLSTGSRHSAKSHETSDELSYAQLFILGTVMYTFTEAHYLRPRDSIYVIN